MKFLIYLHLGFAEGFAEGFCFFPLVNQSTNSGNLLRIFEDT